MQIKRDRHKKKGLEWFFNELRKATKDIDYNAYNPTSDPFIGGMFFFFPMMQNIKINCLIGIDCL